MRADRTRGHVIYAGVACLLGLAWFLALEIPEATRMVILADQPVTNAALMCVVSMVLAFVFRRPVAGARKFWQFLVLALGLPFVGAALWLWLVTSLAWVFGSLDVPLWQEAVVFVYMLPTALGAVALAGYYIIIPMGLLSQYLMHRLAGHRSHDIRAQQAT